MADRKGSGRTNQRRRTRKDLLAAAARLLKEGRTPGMDDVAEAALVSRATAYRYFPSIEALLVEAPLDGAAPNPDELFTDDTSSDPEKRIDKAEASLHEMIYRNEVQLRLMLSASLERAAKDPSNDDIPVRQNRRAGLIEAALDPARDRFTDEAYEKLCASLSLIFGIESMIIFRDVLGLDQRTARTVKSWAARTLVRAALNESAGDQRSATNP
jgi:AcrR family transcriptional regulator